MSGGHETNEVNIAAHLPAMAALQPFRHAVVFPQGRDVRGRVSYTHYTYRQLDEESNRLAHGLERIGIRRGVRTVLMVTPSLEFFALTFALFKVGAVPVMVDPGMGIKNLRKCLDEAGPEAFIGVPKAHVARAAFRWAHRSLRLLVTVGRRLFWGGYVLEDLLRDSSRRYEMARTEADEVAAILFTSGSTGVPKGAVYTHGIFAAQVESIRKTYGIEPGEVDLPTFPLFALFAPALGMTAIVPDMDATRPAAVDPRRIVEAIEDFGVTNMFGSPAVVDKVGRYGESHGTRLPTLRRVISAGAPVPAQALERFVKMLTPGAQVFTPYGATESLPVASIGSDEILGKTRARTEEGRGVCVGRPVEGIDVSVIRISDAPIEEWSDDLLCRPGEIGEITVRGPVVTRSYFNRPESTALAKIADPGSATFHHRMGDLGYLDDDGRLWFCGRKSQRVETPQETLYTIPCEGVFNSHPAVYRSALVGIRRGATVEPVLCVELEDHARSQDTTRLEEEILGLGQARPHTKNISRVLFHGAFPVDIRHNAKIFREKLSEWATRQLT
jgi:acyl-CoA synthetase (AMP-forming)/AMP-acid ligase II